MGTYEDACEVQLGPLLAANREKIRLTIGPPGCGKTTHLGKKATEAARLYGGGQVLIASLTRAAAMEVVKRELPLPRDRIGTLHAHAYRALGHPEIASEKHLPDFKAYCDSKGNPMEITTMDVDVDEIQELPQMKLRGDVVFQQIQTLRAAMTPISTWGQEEREMFRLWNDWKTEEGLMDFEDLIENALLDVKCAPGRPAVIYLDEAQDHSKAELCLALSWAQETNGIVIVGDPDQALYTWRGASPEIVASMVPLDCRRVLEQSYRVPRAVHGLSVRWIDQLPGRIPVAYHPREFEGGVWHALFNRNMGHNVVNHVTEHVERGKTVMILASCGYMLDGIKNALKEQGVPFHNPYRVKHGGWNPMRGCERLLAYLRPDEETWGAEARPWSWRDVHQWLSVVDAKHLHRGVKTEIEAAARDDLVGDVPIAPTLPIAIEMVSACFKDGVEWWSPWRLEVLDKLLLKRRAEGFAYPMEVAERMGREHLRRKPQVILGTIHSVKGGEADVVYLFPDLSPEGKRTWESDPASIYRLFYVGMTRAREELHLAQPAGWCYPEDLMALVQ